MKALIIGGTGQLGRALLASVPVDWRAVGLAREELDLARDETVAVVVAKHSPDVVLNAAAYTAVDRAESEADRAFAVNARGVATLRNAAEAVGARLVHVSTDFVFDGASPRPYRPEDRRNPLSVYGRSKAEGEDAAGDRAAVVRTAWVYGAGGANFVTTMLRLMRTRDEVRVVADQIGAPTWVRSLAATVWSIAASGLTGVYHYSDAGVASWYDFAVAIQEEALALGLIDRAVPVIPITTSDYPTPARRPAFSLLDSTKTRAILNAPSVHWRVNLRRMLAEQAEVELSNRG